MGFSIGGLAYAATAALTSAYGVYSGERQNRVQKEGLNRQRAAQQTAEEAARRQQKLAAEAYAAANRKQPDISSTLADEAQLGAAGPASTLLTGPSGVKRPPARPTTLLGE